MHGSNSTRAGVGVYAKRLTEVLVPRFRGMEGSFSAIFPTGSGGLTPPFHGIGVLARLHT